MPTKPDGFEQWMQQANAVQAQLVQARSRLVDAEVTASSGRVTLSLSATGDLRDIRIDLDTVDDVAELQQQILAAHAEATAAIHEMARDMIRPIQDLVGGVDLLDA